LTIEKDIDCDTQKIEEFINRFTPFKINEENKIKIEIELSKDKSHS